MNIENFLSNLSEGGDMLEYMNNHHEQDMNAMEDHIDSPELLIHDHSGDELSAPYESVEANDTLLYYDMTPSSELIQLFNSPNILSPPLTDSSNEMQPLYYAVSQLPSLKMSHKEHQQRSNSPDGHLKCTFPGCNKTFTKQYSLRSHLRIHTQPKSHVCNVCFSAFRRFHDLKRHEKTHENVKFFYCDTCNKGFTRSDALKRHQARPKSTCPKTQ